MSEEKQIKGIPSSTPLPYNLLVSSLQALVCENFRTLDQVGIQKLESRQTLYFVLVWEMGGKDDEKLLA